jgi:hypothetical protein
VQSFTEKSARRWNESSPQERQSPRSELAMHFERAGEASPAVRYYAEAAEAALANFNPKSA